MNQCKGGTLRGWSSRRAAGEKRGWGRVNMIKVHYMHV
jgi:hypothetical protein